MNEEEFVSAKIASEFYSVTPQTLRAWSNKGKIKYIKTTGGHRRYQINKPFINNKNVDKRTSIIYARVSSSKQKTSLRNQINTLKKKFPKHRLVKDIGSGINFVELRSRNGFKTILEQLLNNNLKELVLTDKDRFSRFGFEFFEWLFQKYNAKILVLNSPKIKPDEQELAEDLIAITTVFTARYHGKRGAKIRKKNKILSDKTTKNYP